MAAGGTEWALTGRDEELALVVGWLRSPEPRPVVLSGAAGVGKSRLAAEASAAVADEFDVEWCAATQSSASIPFGPVTQLLAPGEGTGRISDTLRQSLEAIAARTRPTLIVVDDAHLLDDASATLVHLLAVNATSAVLITRRSGAPAPDPVTALWKDSGGNYLELQALSRDETAELLADALGGPVEGRTIDRLWELTGGNLLFLRELVRGARDDGSLERVRDLWRWRGKIRAPQRLADLVHARIDELRLEDHDGLALIAFGEPLPMAMVRRIVDSAVLARLGRYGLVNVDDTDPAGAVRLAHPLYAEVLRADLSPFEEVEASRLLAEAALGAGAAKGPYSRWVSAWALEAGVELPLELVVDAARNALRSADPIRAADLARAALVRSRSADALFLLGDALLAQERYEEADAALAEAGDRAETDAARARAAVSRASMLHDGLGRIDDSDAVLAEAGARIVDPGLRDFLAAQRATLLGRAGRVLEAGAIAVPLLESSDERVWVRAISAAAMSLALGGQAERVIAASERAFEPALRLRHEIPTAPSWVASSRLIALLVAGELAPAAEFLDMLDALSDEGTTEWHGYRALGRGRLALLQGRPLTAARHLREAASLLDDSDVGGRQGWALSLLAEASTLVGDADGATRASRGAEQATGPFVRLYDGDAERARAWVLVGAGLVSSARATLLDVAQRHRVETPVYELFALHDVVRLGDAGAVVEQIDELAAPFDGHHAPAFAAHARAAADEDGAALDAVSEQFEAFGADLLAAEAAAEACDAHRRCGRKGSASLSAARATRLIARCEGASTPALRHLHHDTGLTRREREIADLAARGLSSPEIAQRLVVSVRTVDNHLQRVYTKLGITGRTELGPRIELLAE